MPSHARKHQLQQSLVYHVYSRSSNRRKIFSAPQDFEYYQALLREYCERFKVKVYHWVIMSNHYHLVIELESPETFSRLMAGLHRSYSHYHHQLYGTIGFLWQGRFKMQPVEKELYLKACGRYVERNPVRAGIVNEPSAYLYSSARYYCLGIADNLTHEDPYFMDFGRDTQEQCRNYQEFLRDFDNGEEGLFKHLDLPCGNREFASRLISSSGHLIPRRKGRKRAAFVS